MSVQLPMAEPPPVREYRPRPATDANGTGIRSGAARRPAAPPSSRAWRLSPRARKAIVAAHVLVGIGWFGIVLAKLVLEIVAATASDQGVARAGLLFMGALDRAVFPPAAIATLITGIVLSVGTAWGLTQHWWIVVKLVLTVGVVVTGVIFVGAWTEQALAATDAELGVASLWLIGAAVVHALMLGAATVVSVFKPWGRIRPDRPRTARHLAVARTT